MEVKVDSVLGALELICSVRQNRRSFPAQNVQVESARLMEQGTVLSEMPVQGINGNTAFPLTKDCLKAAESLLIDTFTSNSNAPGERFEKGACLSFSENDRSSAGKCGRGNKQEVKQLFRNEDFAEVALTAGPSASAN